MGKLKDFRFGNKSFKDYQDDDLFLDDDYHYQKWKKKKKNKRPDDYGDEFEDFVDER